jgi:hypothetical protein
MINKLSEAIRLGDTMIEDERNAFLYERREGIWCGCAIGSALFAMGLGHYRRSAKGPYALLAKYFPIIHLRVRDFKENWCFGEMELGQCISMVHCCGGMSREEIANWVAELERQHPELIKPLEEPKEAADIAWEFFELEEVAK